MRLLGLHLHNFTQMQLEPLALATPWDGIAPSGICKRAFVLFLYSLPHADTLPEIQPALSGATAALGPTYTRAHCITRAGQATYSLTSSLAQRSLPA